MLLRWIVAALLGLLFTLPELEYFFTSMNLNLSVRVGGPGSFSSPAPTGFISAVPEINVSGGLSVIALLLCTCALVYRIRTTH